MTVIQSIVLGIIQGLTELLPISSSAHLYIVPWICNWENVPNWFEVALHFGTLLAIGLFFFKDWVKLISGGINNLKGKRTQEGKLFWYMVIATIPGGIIGFILDHFFERLFDSPIIIAMTLGIMGIILFLADEYCKNKTKYEDLTFKQTFIVGLSQCLAFIPGVSRSGVTITAGRIMGIDRESAAKYSFMLATPIVLGATILKLKDFVFNIECILGVLTSFIIGIVVIKFLLQYLKKGNYKAFAVYRLVLAVIILIFYIAKK